MERVKIVEDAQLKLVQDKPTYIFESLGKRDVNNTYLPSTKFPIGTQYELVKGEFPPPQSGQSYIYTFIGPYGTTISARLISFTNECLTGLGSSVESEMPCIITIQRKFLRENTQKIGEKQMGGKQTRWRKTKRRRRNKSKRRRK
jgi:hypothetical protein